MWYDYAYLEKVFQHTRALLAVRPTKGESGSRNSRRITSWSRFTRRFGRHATRSIWSWSNCCSAAGCGTLNWRTCDCRTWTWTTARFGWRRAGEARTGVSCSHEFPSRPGGFGNTAVHEYTGWACPSMAAARAGTSLPIHRGGALPRRMRDPSATNTWLVPSTP